MDRQIASNTAGFSSKTKVDSKITVDRNMSAGSRLAKRQYSGDLETIDGGIPKRLKIESVGAEVDFQRARRLTCGEDKREDLQDIKLENTEATVAYYEGESTVDTEDKDEDEVEIKLEFPPELLMSDCPYYGQKHVKVHKTGYPTPEGSQDTILESIEEADDMPCLSSEYSDDFYDADTTLHPWSVLRPFTFSPSASQEEARVHSTISPSRLSSPPESPDPVAAASEILTPDRTRGCPLSSPARSPSL